MQTIIHEKLNKILSLRQQIKDDQSLKILGYAILFLSLFQAWEAWLCQTGIISYFTHIFTADYVGSDEMYWFIISRGITILIFIHILTFIYISAISKRYLKIIYFVVFAIAVLIEYGYMNGLGRFSNVNSIYTALIFNEPEIWMDAILAYFNLAVVWPIVAYFIFLWLTQVPQPNGMWLTGIILIFTVSFYSVLFFFVRTHGVFLTPSVGNFLQTAISMPWHHVINLPQRNTPRENVTVQSGPPPDNNIIFIVDESIRGDHLSINNYYRPTTPYLNELATQGYLYNWGISVSGATCSLEANMLLFTGSSPDQLSQVDIRPSIFQYAKAIGYQVHYYDGSDTYRFWFGKPYDAQYTDVWQNASLMETSDYFDTDFVIAKKVKEIVTESSGNFIWINKRGVHFNYSRYYPASETIWEPTLSLLTSEDIFGIDPTKHEEIINAYDNALRYNVNNFFRHLVEPTILDNTIIIYTSDHGQTLSDQGEHWTHCRDTKNEVIVPLFMITRPHYEYDLAYKASHANIFPTLLDLMNYPVADRKSIYAPSLLTVTAADSQNRFYYAHNSGQIYNFDQ